MSRGARIVDKRFTVQDVEQFYIAVNGQAKSVAEAYVADAGVIRQFWPPTTTAGNTIVMTAETEESYATKKAGEGAAIALCSWDARTGRLILSDQEIIKFVDVLAPAPRSAGQYLLRVELVSGDITLEFPTGEWHDVFEFGNLGIFSNFLTNPNLTPSVLYGELTVSVAEDDGAGTPVLSTLVSKTVNMKAEIIGDNLSFSTAPWSLSSVRVNEYAAVSILTVPSGFGFENEAFITGNTWQDLEGFNDNYKEVIREIYAVEWGPQFTVQVDVLSGSVSGSPTGVPLTTSVRQFWEVTAPNPLDDNTATVNVTISDGVSIVVKQVTMRAAQLSEQTETGSDLSDDFTRFDAIADIWEDFDNPPPPVARITLTVNTNGTINAVGLADGQLINFPQDWNINAPSTTDSLNYECRLTSVGDDLYTGSSPTGVWMNLYQPYSWSLYADTSEFPFQLVVRSEADWTLEIREVGRPETVKTKIMTAKAISVGNPDDTFP